MSCSCYHLLFLQLEPLAEDVLHQTPNMNAVISLQKIIEIQSMSSNFLNISNKVLIKHILRIEDMKNIFEFFKCKEYICSNYDLQLLCIHT